MVEYEVFKDGFNYLTIEIKIEIYNRYALYKEEEQIYQNSESSMEKLSKDYSHKEMFTVYKNSHIKDNDKYIFRESKYKWVTYNDSNIINLILKNLSKIFELKWCWMKYLDPKVIQEKTLNRQSEQEELILAQTFFEKDFKEE